MARFSLSKLNNKHFLSLAGNGILAVFGVAQMSLLYHAMAKEVVGEWFFFLTLISLCDAVRNGFLNTATVKFYGGTEKERAAEVLGSVWFLATALTAIVLLLNAGAYIFIGKATSVELVLTVKWLGLTYLSSLPFSVIFWVLQADEKYGKILLLRLVNNGSTLLVFAVLMYLKQLTLENAVVYNFLTNCLTSIVGLIWKFDSLKNIAKRSNATVTEIYHFGKYSLATSLSSTLLRSVDAFIINFMLGPAVLAVYNLPVRLMEIVEIPLRSFVGTGMSSMAVAFNNKNMHHVTYILKKYAGMLTIVFIPLAVFASLFAGIAVELLGGAKYIGSEAANVYRLLMFTAILYPIDRFNGTTLDIIHKPKVNFYKVQVMLIVNIAADFIGISIFHNIYGIVFAVICTVFAGLIFGHIQLRKYVDYTIGGILSTGASELKMLLQNALSSRRSQN